jgi:hypothetical protein
VQFASACGSVGFSALNQRALAAVGLTWPCFLGFGAAAALFCTLSLLL